MFFRAREEIGRHPRLPGRRPRVFPNTGNLALAPAERIWARWQGGTLGSCGVELWTVDSTGHSIDLVAGRKASYHVPLRGRMVLEYDDRDLVTRTGEAAFLGTGRRRTHVIAPRGDPFEALVVLLPTRPHEDPELALVPDAAARSLVATGWDRPLRGFSSFLFRELARPESPLADPRAMEAAGAALLDLHQEGLLAAQGGLPDGLAGASLAQVRQAEAMMHALFAAPLTVADIAREMGVGTRALQLAFRRHRGRAPRAVLGAIRLEEARARLRVAAPGDSVSAVALDCGFTHFGRFSGQYRAAFGETPSETLRRSRQAA